MLVVLSSEKVIEGEGQMITSLFKEGLECLHLRKEGLKKTEYEKLMNSIPRCYHHRIVLCNYWELTHKYSVKGIHLKEWQRQEFLENCDKVQQFVRLKEQGLTVSSSFHKEEDLEKYGKFFDYVFLSPVFDSISKQGYGGRKFCLPKVQNLIIALGGINEDNLGEAFLQGYDGVAVLGAIWGDEFCVDKFKKIKQVYEQAKIE